MRALGVGSQGQDVRNAQKALNYHLPFERPPLALDGIFGPKTLARVIKFQEDNNLLNKPIGVIGPQTHRGLYSFVECEHHLLFLDRPAFRFDGVNRLNIGDAPQPLPSGLQLPPVPRLELQFPIPFQLVPPLVPPRLEIDLNRPGFAGGQFV